MNAQDLARIHALIEESRQRVAASRVAVKHSQKHVALMRESIYRDRVRLARFVRRLQRWQNTGQ